MGQLHALKPSTATDSHPDKLPAFHMQVVILVNQAESTLAWVRFLEAQPVMMLCVQVSFIIKCSQKKRNRGFQGIG